MKLVKQARGSAHTRSSKGGRPSKAEEGQVGERILATASAMFASQGYAATSVERVALACGAGKDTIYRRHPSKEALFAAVVDRARERTMARLEETLETDYADALTRLRAVSYWFLTINLDPELVAFKRIAMSEAVLRTDDEQPTRPDPFLLRLSGIVREAQIAGRLLDGDPDFIASQIINTIVMGPVIQAMLGRPDFEASEAQEAFFCKAWDLFLVGAMPTARRDPPPPDPE